MAWRALSQLGNVARQTGDFESARRHLEESSRLQHEIGDTRAHPWRGFYRAHLLWDEGDFLAAREEFKRALEGFLQIGVVAGMLRSLWALGCVAIAQGDMARFCSAAKRQRAKNFAVPFCPRATRHLKPP